MCDSRSVFASQLNKSQNTVNNKKLKYKVNVEERKNRAKKTVKQSFDTAKSPAPSSRETSMHVDQESVLTTKVRVFEPGLATA